MTYTGSGAAALATSSCTGIFARKNDRPNVLFIAVDDLRPQLNCYGHTQMISPNIDRLAARGVQFNRAFCQVPVCGASRASLLTGIRPHRGHYSRFSAFHTRADEEVPGAVTLPEIFREHGYYTLGNGKVFHHQHDGRGSWSEPDWRPNGEHVQHYLSPESKSQRNPENNYGPSYECYEAADNAYSDGKVADKTISDLRRLAKMERPFFLACGFYKPHLPFVAPKKYWDLYKREDIDLADNPFAPKDAPERSLHDFPELRGYAGIPKEGPLPDELARTLIHGYYACVSYADAQVGRVLDELKRLKLHDNTIVVLWGDHGWNLGEHGLWCKQCNYQTSLRAPLIVSAPGYTEGVSTDALTEFVDIFPTLCDLSSIPVPDHIEGTGFVPLLQKPDRPWKKAVFSQYHAGLTIRTDRYAYTEYQWRNGNVRARMLYDHRKDPRENVNIAALPENKDLVEKLSRLLNEGWRAVDVDQ
ncbi:MAG: sulfatase-like hydrolase/transferase [Chitinivibrionales bacterium]|nr:sulfatase-like hydrolase/transferase [Chitinivibrionales bacterium]MBD3355875.1 sulfatase-like hydrolase/transferase [Chitinivibrionales bacterium]